MADPELQWAHVSPSILSIETTLRSGQCFRWINSPDGEWLGTVKDSIVRLRPASDGFWWQTYPRPNAWDILSEYFALSVDLAYLQEQWIKSEPRIAPIIERFPGLRILRQDPSEVLFSFV